MIVKLSTGEEVHLSDRYTRKAQKAYNLALAVKYVEGAEGGLEMSKEIPVENFNLANDAALLCVVERVVQGTSEQPANPQWLENLATDDYEKLCAALNELKRGKDKKKS